MKKKTLAALILACIMLMGTVSAAWSPMDFAGGSLSGIAADGDDLLVSDVFNKVVWRVTDNKVEQAVGQISIPGLDGEPIGKYDDGTLDSALFMEPWAMAPFLDGFAITDTEAHVVRFFDDKGVYTAVGTGKAGFKDGVGVKASFNQPTGLAVNPETGVLYIADTGNGAIRSLDTKGTVKTVVRGLADPTGLCWANGALYVAESGRSRICRVVGSSVETVVGTSILIENGVYSTGYVDGPAENAQFCNPQGIAVAADGTIYIADTGNGAIRKFAGGRVTTLVAASTTPDAPIQPRGLLLREDGTLVACDLFAQNLLEVATAPVVYRDVYAGTWCYDYVLEATERGLTSGTGNGYFSPNNPVTRAMFVVMLSRMHLKSDGSAVINGDTSFTDVPVDAWYGEAARWAADNEIVLGNNGNFMAANGITRQQMVTLLYRYAQKMGYDVSVGEDTNILSYNDIASVSEYAIPAFQWACGAGIIGGYDDGTLRPGNITTRAQAAKILISFMDYVGI